MENKNLENFKWKMACMQRQFSYNQQGYSLIKSMALRYALLAVNKNVKSIKDFSDNVYAYFESLREDVYKNLDEISKSLGNQFKDVVLDCIVSFSTYNEKDSGFEQALYMMEELSLEGLKEFIIHGVDNFGYRENCGTPATLCDLVKGLFNIEDKSSIMDLGCGNGDFLVNCAKDNRNNIYYGYEINYNSKLLSNIRLTLLGVNNIVYEGDVLKQDNIRKADFIFSHPPFGLRVGRIFEENRETEHLYGSKYRPSQTSEWLFINRIISGLNEEGRGVVVVPEGALINLLDIEQRKFLVDNNYIEAVIKLPVNLFPYTSISTSLIVLRKNKNSKMCKFIDASELCDKNGRVVTLRVDDILKLYNSNETTEVSIEEIVKNEFVLTVNKYRSLEDIKIENPVKLESLVEDVFRGVQIQADVLHKYTTNEDSDGVYKIVASGDIVDSSFDVDKLEKFESQKNYDRYLLKNNDVLISCKSTKVKTAIVDIKEGEKVIPSGSIIVVRCDTAKLKPVYLKMFLDSDIGTKLLASIQTGTIIISINPKALMGLTIACVDLEKQEELSTKYLGTLDMIRLEKMKIEKLEQKLKSIYNDFMEG